MWSFAGALGSWSVSHLVYLDSLDWRAETDLWNSVPTGDGSQIRGGGLTG